MTLLCIAVAGAAIALQHNWSTRYERVFVPVSGLSYEPPRMVDGQPVTDISEPLTFQKLAAQDAYAFNASVPVSTEPMTPSKPFVLPSLKSPDGIRALDCLTAAIYYEAASESLQGQRAVAQVVLNRVRHRAFPNSVCGVVFSGSTRRTGCQFTFTCDGALARGPSAGGWARARAVAEAALSGQVHGAVGQATHYHTLWVAPYWSPSLVKVANIGAHTFYRWKGLTGLPIAFNSPYAGVEPVVSISGTPAEEVEEIVDITVEPSPVISSVEEVDPPEVAVAPLPRLAPPRQSGPAAPIIVQETAEPPVAPSPIEPQRRRRRVATPEW